MTTAALKTKSLTVRSEKLPDTPKPVPWRAFHRFIQDAERLRDYVGDMRRVSYGQDTGEYASGGVAEDAEWFTELVAKVRAGFARFDRDENYEYDDDEGGRVLKSSHIAKRLSVLAVSFPAGNPGSPEGYLKMLIEHVSAVDSLSEPALESACREIVETHKFLPAASEVLKILKEHVSTWRQRRFALQGGEGFRQAALEALLAREAEKEKQEHERQVQLAINAAKFAMRATQQLAKQIEAKKAEIEAKKAELAALLQRHAEAEKRESECMRHLRKVTTSPEEAAEAAAASKANGFGCGEFRFVPGDSGSLH